MTRTETDLDRWVAARIDAPQPAEAATEIGADDDQRVEPGMQMLAVVFIAPMLGVVGLALWAALF
jgi:hypothetical protein